MAKIIARNASFYLEDSAAASRAFSGFLNTITLTRSAETPDVTGFGEVNRQRMSGGLLDFEVDFTAFFATGANETDQVLSGILGGSTLFKFGPSGSSSGCILYTGCGILSEYNADFAVEGAATVSGKVIARSGSLTRGTW